MTGGNNNDEVVSSNGGEEYYSPSSDDASDYEPNFNYKVIIILLLKSLKCSLSAVFFKSQRSFEKKVV
jgi:hypothetical protein